MRLAERMQHAGTVKSDVGRERDPDTRKEQRYKPRRTGRNNIATTETERKLKYMEKINLITAETLFYKPLDHPRMIIEGILSNGLAILAGDSKIGKSWMVLWLCLKLAKGESVWGIPSAKTDVVYLALEDPEWRVQDRMHELTDDPPENIRFGFTCNRIGKDLEDQIKELLKEYPDTGILFIDTLQMVRDNISSRTNPYAQDYKDLSSLKQIADSHNMCIFLVHHTRKEKDVNNIFNDITGSTGLTGVADTCMVLRKDDRFSDEATLSITGRDVEEKQIRLRFSGKIWEAVEIKNADCLKKEQVPAFIRRLVSWVHEQKHFEGTMTELLDEMGEENLPANQASRMITKYYSDVLRPDGISYDTRKTAAARIIELTEREIGPDGNDDDDADFPLTETPSLPSSSSPEEGWIPAWEEPVPFI